MYAVGVMVMHDIVRARLRAGATVRVRVGVN